MDVQQFEQAILEMAFETDARLTTASVAYYLGIPSKKANELLEQLLEQGVLELDSDDEGNLYYYLPNQGHTPTAMSGPSNADDSWDRLAQAADLAAAEDDGADDEPDSPAIDDRHFGASIDDADHQEPISPTEHSPHRRADGDPSSPNRPQEPTRSPIERDTGGSSESPLYGRSTRPQHTSSRFEGVPDGVTSRLGRADARPDRCSKSDSPVVVENAASCEPKPLADSRPTVTACSDVDTSQFSTHDDYGNFGFSAPSSSTALATTSSSGEMTVTSDGHHIEQPEHQPGMALLLSLILCGTGQIYNGEVSKGIIMLILCFLLWFVFLGWVVHIWSIVDAVVVAERINRKSSSSQPSQPQPQG